jgi:hypothetical protein
MNFFYRLPLLTFSHFLLASAQYSGDNTCNFRKICQNRHLNEFPNFLQDGVSSKLPAYSVFIDFFTEKKTLLVSFINSRWELPHPANASQRIYTHAA